jgi:hypothetical protein
MIRAVLGRLTGRCVLIYTYYDIDFVNFNCNFIVSIVLA